MLSLPLHVRSPPAVASAVAFPDPHPAGRSFQRFHPDAASVPAGNRRRAGRSDRQPFLPAAGADHHLLPLGAAGRHEAAAADVADAGFVCQRGLRGAGDAPGRSRPSDGCDRAAAGRNDHQRDGFFGARRPHGHHALARRPSPSVRLDAGGQSRRWRAGRRHHPLDAGTPAAAHCRRTLWGLLLLASPVSSGAALNLLPAVASHYRVGGQGVMWVNGMAGGLVLALGSLLATFVPGEWDRRLTYAGAGLLNGLASLVLLIGNTPAVYFIGTVLYLITTGFGYARFTALVMDVLGHGEHGTSTRYSLFLSAGNLPIAYVLWLDGQGFRHFGTHGLIAVDAAGNFLVFAIVAIAWAARRKQA